MDHARVAVEGQPVALGGLVRPDAARAAIQIDREFHAADKAGLAELPA